MVDDDIQAILEIIAKAEPLLHRVHGKHGPCNQFHGEFVLTQHQVQAIKLLLHRVRQGNETVV